MRKSDSSPAIELIEVGKIFHQGAAPVVDDVTLSIGRGEIFGLVGPNGSGKTTLLKLAVGLLRPTAGRVRVAGIELAAEPLKAKKIIGYAAAEPLLYDRMTAAAHLAFIANAYAMGKETDGRIGQLAEDLGFADAFREPLGQCPPGVRQKVSLASVFLHDPDVIVLDEPWANLDPRAVAAVRLRLKDAAGRGKAVLFSTYFLDIAQRTAGRFGIMRRGKLAAAGAFTSLKKLSGRPGATLENVVMELGR